MKNLPCLNGLSAVDHERCAAFEALRVMHRARRDRASLLRSPIGNKNLGVISVAGTTGAEKSATIVRRFARTATAIELLLSSHRWPE